MLNTENNFTKHYGPQWWAYALDRILNSSMFLKDTDRITTEAQAKGFVGDDPQAGPYWVNGWVSVATKSLFYNATRFRRKVYVDGKLRGLFWSFRWSGYIDRKAFLQCGIGFNLNGRFAVTFRIQSDKSNAAAAHPWGGPNLGHTVSWFGGDK